MTKKESPTRKPTSALKSEVKKFSLSRLPRVSLVLGEFGFLFPCRVNGSQASHLSGTLLCRCIQALMAVERSREFIDLLSANEGRRNVGLRLERYSR